MRWRTLQPCVAVNGFRSPLPSHRRVLSSETLALASCLRPMGLPLNSASLSAATSTEEGLPRGPREPR